MSNCCPCLTDGRDFGCPHHHPGHSTAHLRGTSPPQVDLPVYWLLTPEYSAHAGTPVLHWAGLV